MISTIYSVCFEPLNSNLVNVSPTCRISMIVLELLLIGGGFGLYFSGVGVIPASVLWGAPLVIEVGMLIFSCRPHKRGHDFLEEIPFEDVQLSPIWKLLNQVKIVVSLQVPQHSTTLGVTLQYTNYISPYNVGHVNNEISSNKNDFETLFGIIIAAGPLGEGSSRSFLKMVKSKNIHTVVMATECIEDRIIDDSLNLHQTQVCDPYWQLRDIEVLENSSQKARSLNFEDHETKQYYFTGWCLNQVVDPRQVYACTQKCIEESDDNNIPIVVHDDNGLGRAAAFAICLILHKLHNEAKLKGLSVTIDLDKLIEFLRTNIKYGRYGLIDNPFQYKVITDFAEYLKSPEESADIEI